ncbi:MAG: carbamoyltransferase HypF [Lentisphaeria bacterium]|nr:carbamoyltransferase HypF [Lentisphaeria bacterium]
MKSAVTLELIGRCKEPALRPFMWSLVTKTTLGGWIANTVNGVQLMLEGDELDITLFLRSLPDKVTRWFSIKHINLLKREILPEQTPPKPFRLVGPVFYEKPTAPDRPPCRTCKDKMLDPESRFYRYPFLSCPECGPRYSVTLLAGETREMSTLRTFPRCRTCENEMPEYPFLSCPECGPGVFLIRGNGDPVVSDDPLAAAAAALADGKIVAVKNYDGFVILGDPAHSGTIRLIRERKQQMEKPISFYVNDLQTVQKYCECSPEEESLLTSSAVPLVLLRQKPGMIPEPELYCPDHPSTIGMQFPPNGLIYLLMQSRPDGNGGFIPFEKLAFTGGPVPVDPEDAGGDDDLAEVCRIADLILMHDLKIWQSSGPSVQACQPGLGLQTYRRSNGLAPEPLLLRRPLKRTVLALGADSNAAIAIGFKNKIILSHQMGNIRTERNSLALSHTAEHLALMFARIPEMVVCDMDHTSFSHRMGVQLSEQYRVPLTTVQRHQANAMAGMVEHHLPEVLALVFDGGAFGPDGNIWGAELLEVSHTRFRRLATFSPVPMNPPRERTSRPAFVLTRYLEQCGVELTGELAQLLNIPLPLYREWKQADSSQMTGTHAAMTLFYAVAAAIGAASPQMKYDQQEILRFEHAISGGFDPAKAERLREEFVFRTEADDLFQIDWSPFFRDPERFFRLRKESAGDLSAAFMLSITDAAVQMAEYGATVSKCRNVLLSGKTFLSPSLTRSVQKRLEEKGFKVYRHVITSPDESSVSIGQALFGGMA